jgi:hypothetical protein
MIGDAEWSKQLNLVVRRTAARLSATLDQMTRDLPEDAAPQMALEQVLAELTLLQPWFLELIVEDHFFGEAYEEAVAKKPATRPHPLRAEDLKQ